MHLQAICNWFKNNDPTKKPRARPAASITMHSDTTSASLPTVFSFLRKKSTYARTGKRLWGKEHRDLIHEDMQQTCHLRSLPLQGRLPACQLYWESLDRLWAGVSDEDQAAFNARAERKRDKVADLPTIMRYLGIFHTADPASHHDLVLGLVTN